MDKLTLYPIQEQTVDRMQNEPTRSILLASEQDQGKTAIAIEFALRMGFKRVLFIGIKDTFAQFRDRALAQSDGHQTIRRIDSSKQGKRDEDDLLWGTAGWYFMGQQLFTSRDWKRVDVMRAGKLVKESQRTNFWKDLNVDLIVYDEVHMASRYGGNGQKTIHSVHGTWNIAMSGTFYGNKFPNSWAPTRWLWPDIIERSFYEWSEKWVDTEPLLNRGGQPMLTPRGKALKAAGGPVPDREIITVVNGETPPEGRFVASLPCYIRHIGKESVPDPKIIEVDLLPEQRRMYEALERNLLVWVKERPYVVEFPVTLRERLRTATLGSFDFLESVDSNGEVKQEIFFPEDSQSTKIDALFVELNNYPDDKVILGTHSKKFAKLVVKRMQDRGMKAVEWDGDISSKQRDEIKYQWINDEIQYIVCVFRSFATGLDWAQTNCWRMGVLSEQVGDPTTMNQWVRRVFRTGPHKGKFEWFSIQARNSYDAGEFQNRELQSLAQAATLKSTN